MQITADGGGVAEGNGMATNNQPTRESAEHGGNGETNS